MTTQDIAIVGYAQSPSWREAELTEPQPRTNPNPTRRTALRRPTLSDPFIASAPTKKVSIR